MERTRQSSIGGIEIHWTACPSSNALDINVYAQIAGYVSCTIGWRNRIKLLGFATCDTYVLPCLFGKPRRGLCHVHCSSEWYICGPMSCAFAPSIGSLRTTGPHCASSDRLVSGRRLHANNRHLGLCRRGRGPVS